MVYTRYVMRAMAQVELQLSESVSWGFSDCTYNAFSLNYLVMIIPLNYPAIINSMGELMRNSHCTALVISAALFSLSVFLLRNRNPFCFHKEPLSVNSALFFDVPISASQRKACRVPSAPLGVEAELEVQ